MQQDFYVRCYGAAALLVALGSCNTRLFKSTIPLALLWALARQYLALILKRLGSTGTELTSLAGSIFWRYWLPLSISIQVRLPLVVLLCLVYTKALWDYRPMAAGVIQ